MVSTLNSTSPPIPRWSSRYLAPFLILWNRTTTWTTTSFRVNQDYSTTCWGKNYTCNLTSKWTTTSLGWNSKLLIPLLHCVVFELLGRYSTLTRTGLYYYLFELRLGSRGKKAVLSTSYDAWQLLTPCLLSGSSICLPTFIYFLCLCILSFAPWHSTDLALLPLRMEFTYGNLYNWHRPSFELVSWAYIKLPELEWLVSRAR